MPKSIHVTLVCLAIGWQATASEQLQIVSPDTAETYPYSSADRHHLYWSSQRQILYAHVTFSNHMYSGDTEPLDEESFRFDLPGVTFEPDSRKFSVTAGNNHKIPIATLEKGFLGLGSYIRPLPGTQIAIYRNRGEVRVVLTANADGQRRLGRGTWVELNQAQSPEVTETGCTCT